MEHPPDSCRACGLPNEAVSNVYGNRGPRSGDRTVCLRCGEMSVLEIGPLGQVIYRELTDDEFAETVADPRVQRMQQALNRLRAELPPFPQ